MKQKIISFLIKEGISSPEKALEVYEYKALRRIDIKNKKYTILQSITYSKNGDVLDSSDFHSFAYWDSIPPDTLIEALWKTICEISKKRNT